MQHTPAPYNEMNRITLSAIVAAFLLAYSSPSASLAQTATSGTVTLSGSFDLLVDSCVAVGQGAMARFPNAAVAPYDLTRALGILTVGASGRTTDGLLEQLEYPSPSGQFLADIAASQLSFENESTATGVTLNAAVFLQQRYRYARSFKHRLKRYFTPDFLPVTFLGESSRSASKKIPWIPVAEDEITAWLEADGQDGTLLDGLEITNSSRFAGVSTTAFTGTWNGLSGFQVTTERFQLRGSNQVWVPMLNGTGTFMSYSGTDYSAVELPFSGCDERLLIIRPATGAFDTFSSRLSGEWLRNLVESLAPTLTEIYLPLFSKTAENSVDETLTLLEDSGAYSDFGARFVRVNRAGHLKIKDVAQQTSVSVDQTGMRFLSATGVLLDATADESALDWYRFVPNDSLGASSQMVTLGVQQVPPDPALAKASPFIYVLYNQSNGLPVAMGEVTTLSGSSVPWTTVPPSVPSYGQLSMGAVLIISSYSSDTLSGSTLQFSPSLSGTGLTPLPVVDSISGL